MKAVRAFLCCLRSDQSFSKSCRIAFAVIVGLLCLALQLAGQPTGCSEDSQCPSGFYCEQIVHFCSECVNCELLKRELPRDSCAKSVLDCGPCTEGLVENLLVDPACVQPSERSEGDRVLPVYAWVFIGLLLVVFCAIAIYVICKKDTLFSNIFKIRTSTSVRRCPHSNGNGAVPGPSAPAQPPPPAYNSIYAPERPNSPDDSQPYSNGHLVEEDSARPFIKRSPPDSARGPREAAAAGRQAALPYANPTYIRGPAPVFGLPSIDHGENTDAVPEVFPPHDEDTMESNWTPNAPINYYDVTSPSLHAVDGVASAPSTSTVVAAPTLALVAASAARNAKPDREDSNNNRGHDSDGAAPPAAPHRELVHITVVTSINNIEQHNNLNLSKH